MIECLAAVAYIAQYDVVFKECKNKKVAEEMVALNIIKSGFDIGERMKREEYSSFEKFLEKFNKGATNLNKIESSTEYFGNGIFVRSVCGFDLAINDWMSLYGSLPEWHDNVIKELRKRGIPAICMLCGLHQALRQKIGEKTLINKRPCNVYHLASRDIEGNKYYQENLDKKDKKELEKLLDEYSCIFYFYPKTR